MEGTLMPLLFGALMALVCFCIGISKGYSALWSAVAGFFGHMITAAILLLLPDREQGAAEAKWRRDAQAQEIAQLKARVAQLEALLELNILQELSLPLQLILQCMLLGLLLHQ